jgi:transcriptional regulator of met regulon
MQEHDGMLDGMLQEIHLPHGTKREFRKLTVTLSPALFAQVLHESTRRKVAGAKHANTSAVIREALAEYFRRHAASEDESGPPCHD